MRKATNMAITKTYRNRSASVPFRLPRFLLPFTFYLFPLLLAGCNNWPHLRNTGTDPQAKMPNAVPTATDLVNYVNDNSRRLQSLECRQLYLDATQGMQSIGLKGWLVCQKSRNFRMTANVANATIDLGSNDQEFWFWSSKNDPPYLFHCAYQDFAQGRARMPFPFQPEWVMEALGVAEMDPNKNYQVVTKPGTFELVEKAVSPQGQTVYKVTVFNRAPNQVQVTAHLLLDAAGKEICSAHIAETQQDQASGAVYPRRIQLVWPAERTKLKMKLDDVYVNSSIQGERQARLFSRPNLKDVQTYNLARDFQSPTSQVRQAGGLGRPIGAMR